MSWSTNVGMGRVEWYQKPPRHPSRADEEKLSSLNAQLNGYWSLWARLGLRLERLGLGGLGGWGRKARTSLSERLLVKEGPRISGGWVTINGVAPWLLGSGGVDNDSSESSDSKRVEEV